VNAQKPREIAINILREHAEGRHYLEDLFEQNGAKNSLSPSDRGLLQEITFGAVRWQATLDWLISRRTAGRVQKTVLQVILRLGLYQLLWLDRIPPHAAVHEMVELAKAHGFGPQSGFVNAMLRGYAREIPAAKALLKSLQSSDPALGFSHPAWLVQRWKDIFGVENTRSLLEWNNQPPPTYARLNRIRTHANDLREQWEKEGVEPRLQSFPWSATTEMYHLLRHPPFSLMESFRSGCFYVQDPSTLLAVELLDPKPGEFIWDMCAAPGGKTLFAAQKMGDSGRIVASDSSPDRLKSVAENYNRLGVKCVEINIDPGSLGQFDRVLVDAPCSNTGVMRRRVDLRWRIQPREFTRLAEVQMGLLNTAAQHLKPAGTLVYSTCSLEPEENENVVRRFLEANPNYRLELERGLAPFKEAVDGAFVAKMIKTS
jgi:16S rRNA (cytosine967-C5)-methyltransferase